VVKMSTNGSTDEADMITVTRSSNTFTWTARRLASGQGLGRHRGGDQRRPLLRHRRDRHQDHRLYHRLQRAPADHHRHAFRGGLQRLFAADR
jgi:hypothetical protein